MFTFYLILGELGSFSGHFMFSFPPAPEAAGDPYMMITAERTGDVIFTTDSTYEIIKMKSGESIIHPVSNSYRVTTEIETKGIELSSGMPITVKLGSSYHGDRSVPDDALVRPIHDTSTEFYVINILHDTIRSASQAPLSFFTITASEDNTVVDIFYDMYGVTKQETLNKYQSFTEDAYYSGGMDTDFTGVRVNASKPVSVLAGHGSIQMGDFEGFGYICDFIPSFSEVGKHYVTYPLTYGTDDSGYSIRVMPVYELALVRIPSRLVSIPVDVGSYFDIGHFSSSFSAEVCILM